MNVLHYILALLALLALVPTLVYLLPGHPRHFLPALTVGLAVLVYFLPTALDAAVSLVVPATILIRRMPLDPVPSESLSYAPLIAWCRRAANVTASWLRTPVPPTPVTEYVQHGYPDPATGSASTGDAGDDRSVDGSDAEAPVDGVDPGQQRARELQDKIKAYGATVPGARGGIRTSATGVRSFVPEL